MGRKGFGGVYSGSNSPPPPPKKKQSLWDCFFFGLRRRSRLRPLIEMLGGNEFRLREVACPWQATSTARTGAEHEGANQFFIGTYSALMGFDCGLAPQICRLVANLTAANREGANQFLLRHSAALACNIRSANIARLCEAPARTHTNTRAEYITYILDFERTVYFDHCRTGSFTSLAGTVQACLQAEYSGPNSQPPTLDRVYDKHE